MKKLLIFAMLLTGIMLVSCSSSDDASDAQQNLGSIYGIVTELGTAEPMKAMGVELYKDGSLLLKTVTFDDGHYEFTDLKSGNYKLRIMAEGYEKTEYDVVVESGRQSRADMQAVKVNTLLNVRTTKVDIVGNEVTLNGEYSFGVHFDMHHFPSEVGFMYASQDNPKKGGTIIKAEKNEEDWTFSSIVSNLDKGIYYVQAYAKNSIGIAYGEVLSFEIKGTPAVKTLQTTNITAVSATLNGEIIYAGSPMYSERGFVYSSTFVNPTVDDAESATTKVKVSGKSKDFSANVAGLTKNKTYYVRAYVSNNEDTWYGERISFSTDLSPYIVIEGLAVQKQDLGSGSWSTAKTMCEASRLGGFSDWRLPTISELAILYTYRDEIGGFKNACYWSSSQYKGSDWVYDYYYDFIDGTEHTTNSTEENYYVRAVRTVK